MSICNGNGRYGTGGNENFSGTRNTVCSASCLSQVDRERLGALIASVSSFPVTQTLVLENPGPGVLDITGFSVDQWIQSAAPSGLFLDISGVVANLRVTIGSSTSQDAARFMSLFGLKHVGDSVLLKFPFVTTGGGGAVLLRTDSIVLDGIIFRDSGGAPTFAINLNIGPTITSNVPLVQVTVEDATEGSEVIAFNSLYIATP